MLAFLLACLGGAAGVAASGCLGAFRTSEQGGRAFPHGALATSMAGSFALGAILHFLLSSELLDPGVRVALATGALGGFITHSAFNNRARGYFQRAGWLMGAWNILATAVGCLASGMLGLLGARWLFTDLT